MSDSWRGPTRWWRLILIATAIALVYSAIGATRAWSAASGCVGVGDEPHAPQRAEVLLEPQ